MPITPIKITTTSDALRLFATCARATANTPRLDGGRPAPVGGVFRVLRSRLQAMRSPHGLLTIYRMDNEIRIRIDEFESTEEVAQRATVLRSSSSDGLQPRGPMDFKCVAAAEIECGESHTRELPNGHEVASSLRDQIVGLISELEQLLPVCGTHEHVADVTGLAATQVRRAEDCESRYAIVGFRRMGALDASPLSNDAYCAINETDRDQRIAEMRQAGFRCISIDARSVALGDRVTE